MQFKLQNVIFPSVNTSTEEKLYFRRSRKGKSDFDLASGALYLHEQAEVSFDTYFNSFSIGKWFKYTTINNATLQLRIKGKFSISLLYKEEMAMGQIMTQLIHNIRVDTRGEEKEVSLPLDCHKLLGMYAFRCTSLEDHSVILGGGYYTEVQEIAWVKMAIAICTFRREQYVYKNIDLLKKAFIENDDAELVDKLMVYISDNGKTLALEELSGSNVRVFPNKNVGGAGGFTRGLMEISKEKEQTKVTHVLLMDDDVIIQPESIYRTYAMWALLKSDYLASVIGGGVLNLDRPWAQIESGAYWNIGEVKARKSGLDLRKVESCLRNEIEEYVDFQGWWYCSFSMERVREDNLPLPVFIKGDDIEYGIRGGNSLILLNGICVWHEPFEYKNMSSFYYYWYRNWLINNGVRGEISVTARKIFWRELKARVIQECFTLRYKNAALLLVAVEDFLKGIDWLKEQDGEILNQQIMASGYHLVTVEDLEIPFDQVQYRTTRESVEGKLHRLWRRAILNGIFLRSSRAAIVPTVNPHIYYLYKKKRALNYDYSSKKGFITVKDNKEFIRLLLRLWRVKGQFRRKYTKISQEYNVRGRELMEFRFWEKYLGL